ncbi:hypothetical protein C9J01_21640 [Photobacterium rosenbergii]|uniref:Uncharacterized protein n=2 Tax=Photobacterium rosenbergii TaxID=294936 RepID=A0A2T3N7Y7_9GAMM|nr:hypothetical protein C9J01_21640 [Photobacterium rosenbergii]
MLIAVLTSCTTSPQHKISDSSTIAELAEYTWHSTEAGLISLYRLKSPIIDSDYAREFNMYWCVNSDEYNREHIRYIFSKRCNQRNGIVKRSDINWCVSENEDIPLFGYKVGNGRLHEPEANCGPRSGGFTDIGLITYEPPSKANAENWKKFTKAKGYRTDEELKTQREITQAKNDAMFKKVERNGQVILESSGQRVCREDKGYFYSGIIQDVNRPKSEILVYLDNVTVGKNTTIVPSGFTPHARWSSAYEWQLCILKWDGYKITSSMN